MEEGRWLNGKSGEVCCSNKGFPDRNGPPGPAQDSHTASHRGHVTPP